MFLPTTRTPLLLNLRDRLFSRIAAWSWGKVLLVVYNDCFSIFARGDRNIISKVHTVSARKKVSLHRSCLTNPDVVTGKTIQSKETRGLVTFVLISLGEPSLRWVSNKRPQVQHSSEEREAIGVRKCAAEFIL